MTMSCWHARSGRNNIVNDQSSAPSGASFVNIGERTNVTGSARFKKLILGDDYNAAVAKRREANNVKK